MRYLIVALLLSGCVNSHIPYDYYRKTMAEQQMDRLDNMERTLINEAKQYQQ